MPRFTRAQYQTLGLQLGASTLSGVTVGAATGGAVATTTTAVVGGAVTAPTAGAVAGSLGATALLAALPLPIVLGVSALIANRQAQFPLLEPRDIGLVVQEAIDLRARGLAPRITQDPFTGNLALSTEDQSAFLLELLAASAVRARAQEQFDPLASRFFAARETLIENRRQAAEQLGFPQSLAEVQDVRVQAIRPAADQPLELVPQNPFPIS